MIRIEAIDGETFSVYVDGTTPTTHKVRLKQTYCEKLTAGRGDAETLIRKSFEFLLQREPNTSILGSFELSVIGQYFPDYDATIRKASS